MEEKEKKNSCRWWGLPGGFKKNHQTRMTKLDPLVIGHEDKLPPLLECPTPKPGKARSKDPKTGVGSGAEPKWWKQVKGRLTVCRATGMDSVVPSSLLAEVLGAPLGPAYFNRLDCSDVEEADPPVEVLIARYIIKQYTAGSGGQPLLNSINSTFAVGKFKMLVSKFENGNRVLKNKEAAAESGEFVLWQMNTKWCLDLAFGEIRIHSGCNDKLVWSNNPGLCSHIEQGSVRPLCRALQGIDPKSTASMFADAKYIGEKKVNEENCFVLELQADPQTLTATSEGNAENLSHVLFGYFSQKSGLLVSMEDSYLTRIQSNSGESHYLETTYKSFVDNYKAVKGIVMAHSGHSEVTLVIFGDTENRHCRIKMEESWTIEDVAFNIPGLSDECFIPPADLSSKQIHCGKSRDTSAAHHQFYHTLLELAHRP